MKRMAFGFLTLASLLAGGWQAKADLITGDIYQNTSQASNAVVNTGLGTPNATFSVNGALNYNIQSGGTGFTVENFLSNATITPGPGFTANAPFSNAGNLSTGTYLLFFGTTTLAGGQNYTYTFNHDDGASLQVFKNGNLIGQTNDGGPTSVSSSSLNLGVLAAGTYTYILAYGEVNGAPAVLNLQLNGTNVVGTPEPATLTMAAAGLVAFGGYKLRRRKQVVA